MTFTKKYFKTLLGVASAISMLFTGAQAHAAQTSDQSPLLSQSQNSQASVADMVNAIKNAAGGSVNDANASAAVAEAIAGSQGVSADTVAAALNQLSLSDAGMGSAISSASNALGTSNDKIASAMITDAYMKGGKAGANAKISSLRNAVGSDTVNKSLESVPVGMLASAGDLQNIEPAAGGVYEG